MKPSAFHRAVIFGIVLAVVLAYSIASLDALAFPRSAEAELEHKKVLAALLHLSLRHVPVVLIAFLAGTALFAHGRPVTGKAIVGAALPWLLYVVGVSAYEMQAHEIPLQSLLAAAWYVGWPNLLSVPVGLLLAAWLRVRAARKNAL